MAAGRTPAGWPRHIGHLRRGGPGAGGRELLRRARRPGGRRADLEHSIRPASRCTLPARSASSGRRRSRGHDLIAAPPRGRAPRGLHDGWRRVSRCGSWSCYWVPDPLTIANLVPAGA